MIFIDFKPFLVAVFFGLALALTRSKRIYRLRFRGPELFYPTDNPVIETLNGWIKGERYLDYGLKDADDVPSRFSS
jgi:hypothetical protein